MNTPEEKPCKSGPYGEHGCGVHDDTDALQHMIDLGAPIPHGTYRVSGPIVLPSVSDESSDRKETV